MGLPVAAVIIAIGAQGLIASQLGLGLGAAIGEHLRERAGQLAGVALILLGCYLIVQRAVS